MNIKWKKKMFIGLCLFSVENVKKILQKSQTMTVNGTFLINVNVAIAKLLICVLLKVQNLAGVLTGLWDGTKKK